jgi:hypothetical protein
MRLLTLNVVPLGKIWLLWCVVGWCFVSPCHHATLPLFQLSTFSPKRFLDVFLFSVELIGSRWWRSLSVIKAVSKKEHTCPPALFLHADIMDCSTFSPFTHVYTFDRGFRKSMLLYVLVCARRTFV